MAEGYKIRAHQLQCGDDVLVLMPAGRDKDFLEETEAMPDRRTRFRLIIRTMEKIGQIGVLTSRRVGFVRMLDNRVGLVEVAVPGKVIRVMTYAHGDNHLVLLFDFDGHQGSEKIKQKDLARGKRLARIARQCMEE